MFCVNFRLRFLIFAFYLNFKQSDSVVHYFFDQKPPPFQQRLEIVSGMRWGFFNWPFQNLLKFGQITNIWKIHSANFLHIKKLKFQKTLPPRACVYCSLNHMWPLSRQAREYPGSCLWSETSILLARERQEPMPEWRSSCPACFVLHVASSYHSRNLGKGGVQKTDLEKDKEQK